MLVTAQRRRAHSLCAYMRASIIKMSVWDQEHVSLMSIHLCDVEAYSNGTLLFVLHYSIRGAAQRHIQKEMEKIETNGYFVFAKKKPSCAATLGATKSPAAFIVYNMYKYASVYTQNRME